ncbi:autotransporter assembly complex family protein [Gammaproteobacteria bacterium AB-CW1]|uniref:Translocation and assembly module subunit TamA n=1 Tax=Natronospira elongata TaxID=3110268 RepID=A0AAP6JDL6_9GAMM|nr:autotransporter assembly complex family protein [Gammaproteobacteria bacterium AB-CW1]
MSGQLARSASLCLLLTLLLALAAAPAQAQSVRIEIEGLEGQPELRENVLANLSLQRYRDDAMGEPRLRRLHGRATGEVRRALRPFGHYQAEVESELRQENDRWIAVYRIEPGPRVQVESVEARVEGDGEDDRAFQRVLETLPIRAGQPLNHQHYDQARNRLLEVASRHGYLEARWLERSLMVDPVGGTARVRLIMETGPRFRFGETRIEQDILDDAFVQRYVPFSPGDHYDEQKLVQLQYGLSDSEYFSFVQIQRDMDNIDEEGRVPIIVETTQRPKHRYQASLGYGTDTGPRFGVRWDYRRINRRGHHGALGYNISQVRRAVELRYVVPLAKPTRERLTWDANAIREDRGDDLESRRLELGVGRTTQWGSWQRTHFLRYEQERSIFGPDEESRSEIVVPGIRITRTRADDPTLARRGLYLKGEVRGAREEALSDLNFFQARIRAKRVQPLGEDYRLLARLELGGTGTENFDQLPLSQRFFTGGDQTIRGYSFEELSPEGEDGRKLGGRYLAVASLELDRRIRGPWHAAAFVDHGNAMMSFSERLETSAGMGIRWASPVGMVRLDVAQSISDTDRSPRLHLSVGPDL